MNFPFLLIILGPLRGDGTNGSQVRIHKARGFLWGKVPLVYQMDGKKHIIFMGKKTSFSRSDERLRYCLQGLLGEM